MGKKIKKAVKKVTKSVKKVVNGVAGGLAGLAGGAHVAEAPAPAAQIVDVPEKEVSTEDEAQTESGRKKARAGGKKSLSVARSSGGGINI
ncbi:host range and adsorption protein [Yersinia phage vB_YpYeO9]|uniref:Host range and adsorption protein n=1 Tax=Yersinia phage vB_YpYeO9 TaxID=3056114 RepID=A0AA51VH98_9CAUD|nr:host range and adsorption protein [Yersinia phage vB_YpYeO9]